MPLSKVLESDLKEQLIKAGVDRPEQQKITAGVELDDEELMLVVGGGFGQVISFKSSYTQNGKFTQGSHPN
ncbi:hypothetical protein VT06_16360 [Arsukibacterium sp. MJ3]|uniref:hypothetical protein n=1 Tax=Arsukibacterium sp. MJ3 TaxID=1632859 RepID=UPI0006271E72|nr:hypothetical protein [Arsukibacterium sp. MJ3]KKO47566.1 hypothetical protein VT06_16360 [Arsukibacterium sp. MJ3]